MAIANKPCRIELYFSATYFCILLLYCIACLGSIQDSGVIQSAAALNTPLIVMDEVPKVAASSLFTTDQPSVVIDTVKVLPPY